MATIPGFEEILTLRELANYLKKSKRTLEYWIVAKKMPFPGYRLGGSWCFKKSDVDAWIESQRTTVITQNAEGGAR